MSKVALVTGASAGLGVEFAKQLSARGHRLVLAARRLDRLEALARQVGNARAVAIDLSEPGAAERLVADCDAAGEVIDLNIGALTDLCRLVAPRMAERKSGAILNVASTAAFQAGPKMAVYFASKAYVLSFTEALHEEMKPLGVKVSALCPGPTRTEFGEVAGFGEDSRFDRIAMSAQKVVRQGLDGLEANKAVVITGALNKAGAWGTRFLPRSTLRRIAGALKF